MIGESSNRGSTTGGIESTHDSGCPYKSGMRYKYASGGSWHDAPKNSVSLTCS